ncbi:MAG: isoleucine--tRNA ligase [bacterium]
MYKPLPEKLSYPLLEHKVLDFWEQNKIFEKSLDLRNGKPVFSFYEGPPTVNGKPGIHHLMARTIKDTICRYKTMSGYYVRRQAGWDTHGLPVEITVEKELGLNNKDEVLAFGIENFNKKCKEFVYRNIEMDMGWRYLTRRMGYWIDLDKAYITCTNNYVESVWWALKSFFDKGLIYKDFKVVPQSPTIETPLSSHELALPGGYKEVRDPNCYIKLKVVHSNVNQITGASILVWTTTPWTLLSNVALAVGVDFEYVLVLNKRKFKEEEFVDKLVLAKERLNILDGEFEILATFKGKDLLGTVYEQIFNFRPIDRGQFPNALTVLPGDFVSTEDGSGVVHIAPAFGEDDYNMRKKFKLPLEQPVTPNGHFTDDMGEFAGRAIKNFTYPDHKEEGADKDIVFYLKRAEKLYKSSNDYVHNYPHCWRTGNPVIYYARESWFIKSPKYKDKMVELNKQINWQPPEIGEGRFGNWLEEVKDWNLSRDRFWGTPIPIWVSEDGKDSFAIGSIKELEEGLYLHPDGTTEALRKTGIEIDLHRPFVDNIVFEKNGKRYKRIPEIVDVWFDSGSMPFAQFHYPFENMDLFNESFPSDFIAEGIDQTRGWFYTLHNIATALFEKPAYKNIVVNELILDEKGIKMSKSKGNIVDPFDIMERYGADAVRWYLYVNNPPWKATLFSEKDIARTVISDFFRSLTNTYAFFALYANIDDFTGREELVPINERPEIDRWIISRTNSLIENYKEYMDDYELTKAHRAIQSFVIYELSNWYIRRNRRRFWKGDKDKDKIAAYQTLRQVLLSILNISASCAPYLTEELYLKIRNEDEPESIHLCDMVIADKSLIDTGLERRMLLAQTIVSLARFLREKSKIRVRQPLKRILIPIINPKDRRDIQHFADIIKEELNIKEIEFVGSEANIVQKSAKPDFKVIGKKFGKMAQKVANAIKSLTHEQICELEKNSRLNIIIDDSDVFIELEDIEILSEEIEGWIVASEDNITVALDTQIDETLKKEGIAREFVSKVQNIRKQLGFEVVDRIDISVNGDVTIINSLFDLKDYIINETLANDIIVEDFTSNDNVEIDGSVVSIKINKRN